MKRIVVFIVAVVALICPLFAGNVSFNEKNAVKVCFISHEEIEMPDEVEIVKNGNQFYYTFAGEKYGQMKSLFKKFDGVNFYYQSGTKEEELIKTHNISSYYFSEVEGMKILYGYKNDFSDFRFIDGKKINVQIAWAENETIVGFPLIMTGF